MRERQAFRNSNPLCAMCDAQGIVKAGTEVDHVVPLEDGGSDSASNKQNLCAECHKVKTAKDRGYVIRPQIGLDGYPT